jgi:outer membrane protein
MKKIFSLFVLMTAFIGFSEAQNKDTASANYFSLQQAIEYAGQHQKDMLNSDLDVQMADAKVGETRGAGLPQVNANFDFKDYFELNYLFPGIFGANQDPGTFVGFPIETPTYSSSVGVQASQLLFDGSFFVALRASKTYREMSRKNQTRTRIDMIVSVSKAYYNMLVNQQRLNLVIANVNRLKKLKDDTQAMYTNGFVERVDMDRVNLTYNNVVTEQEKTERLIKLSEFYLKFQMGMNVNTKIVLTDSLNAEQLKNISLDASKPDVTNRIEYSILKSQQELYELDARRYKAHYLPSLVLYGSLNTMNQRAKFDAFDTKTKWFPTGFVGVQLSLPIFSGLAQHNKVEQAELSIRKIKNEIDNTTNALDLENISTKTSLANAIATLSTQEKNLDLANEVYNVSKLKYDQGVGSNLEVITAETSLKEAQINYYTSLYDALVAKVDLDKAMGAIK